MTCLQTNHEVLRGAEGLTIQQKRILYLLTLGYQNKVIGAALGISESSVKSHITRLFTALSCTNRTQVALVALCLERNKDR